jgi:glycosyltransferase involved in cell wall biosynthesis
MTDGDNRIRVVHLISGLGTGGAEGMLLLSARHHDRDRFRMEVVSLMSGGELAGPIREEGVKVLELGQVRGRLSLASLSELTSHLRQLRPHILQGHMFHANTLARVLKPLLPKTTVIATRHIDQEPLVRRVINFFTSLLGSGSLVFSPRVLAAEKSENLRKNSVRLVPYGIEIPELAGDDGSIRRELGIPGDTFMWVTAGRLTAQKGYVHLLEAAAHLLETGSSFALVIAGSGELEDELKEKARSLGLDGVVVFPGLRQDIPEFLRASDAFVLSSLWEGGPLVVLEAMAQELPVAATRVGDTEAMVREGDTGFLVEPGDAASLARAMKQVMELGSQRAEFGRRAREDVLRNYSFMATQEGMERYYAELAGDMTGEDS